MTRGSGSTAQHTGATPRRELAIATTLCAAGAALALVAAGRTWVRVSVELPRPLPDATHALSGQQLAPVAGALGIAGLAGLGGLVATRGYARAVVGGLLTVFGLAIAYASFRGTGQVSVDQALAAGDVAVRGGNAAAHATVWWMVSFAGGILLAAGGVLSMVRGRRWPGMSRKYDSPVADRRVRAAKPEGEQDEQGEQSRDMWESLDLGRDPTE